MRACAAGKKRRLTFMECNNDISCMIDLAKVADLVRSYNVPRVNKSFPVA